MQYPPWFYFYRTGNIAGLIFMPFSFLYFRAILKQKSFKPIDLLHFLPLLIFVIDYFPIYFMGESEKLVLVRADMLLDDRGQKIQNGWISPQIPWNMIPSAQVAIYWIFQMSMLYSKTKVNDAKKLLGENRPLIRSLFLLSLLQTLYFVPYFINSISGSKPENFLVIYTSLALGTVLLDRFREELKQNLTNSKRVHTLAPR